MTEQMTFNAAALTAQAQECARTCLGGCPAESYGRLTALLTALTASAALFNPQEIKALNELMGAALLYQQKNDLTALFDLTQFYLPDFIAAVGHRLNAQTQA